MANYVHEEDVGSHTVGSHRRVCWGSMSHTLGELAEFSKVWSEYDRSIELAVTWADVSFNIVVKEVAAPATSVSWKICEAALTLKECEIEAHFFPHLRFR